MATYGSFLEAKLKLQQMFLTQSYTVRASRWQGIDVSEKLDMAMKELYGHSILVPLRGIETLDYWQNDTTPNLPWADEHFEERVGGQPLNPGNSWKNWPWSNSADTFRTENGVKFAHTYMERFWPKYAGKIEEQRERVKALGYREVTDQTGLEPDFDTDYTPHRGIRYEYGDLNDLVEHLASDPLSRQAYLPIWFPEDGTCKGRKPCTLGYHFLMRHDHLHLTYYIRSCDFVRHWSDDCYLAVRLQLWVLDQLRQRNEAWKAVKLGLYTMHIASLHMFVNDWNRLSGKISSPIPG